MAMSVTVFRVFVVFIGICIWKECYTLTVADRALVGLAFRKVKVSDWMQCLQLCTEEPECFSYNYGRYGDVTGFCELNSSGRNKLCDLESSLVFAQGFVFQQLRKYKENASKPQRNESQPTVTPTRQPAWNGSVANVTCTRTSQLSFYVDGKDAGGGMCNRELMMFMIPAKTQVVAFYAFDHSRNQKGVIGSFSSGIVTDKSWKCTTHSKAGWAGPGFNDADWPAAVTYRSNSNPVSPMKEVKDIAGSAEWIWVGDNKANQIYCRKSL